MRYGNTEEFEEVCEGRCYHPLEVNSEPPIQGEQVGGAERGLGSDGMREAVGGAVELQG